MPGKTSHNCRINTPYTYITVLLISVTGHCQHYQCDDFTKPNYCEHVAAVLDEYKELHKQVVTQQTEGRFLKYICNSRCGGYGNRIQGITLALMFAILSNRTLLIEMTFPFDINILLHPNAIQWNYKLTNSRIWERFIIMDEPNLKEYWPKFSEVIFNSNIHSIEIQNNLGFFWFFKVFDDRWTKLFHYMFGVSQNDHMFSYGCAYRYLFTYDKRVTDAIDKEMQQLQLTPGKYVSAHYRTFVIGNDLFYNKNVSIDPSPYLQCGIAIANLLGKDTLVYFISDLEELNKRITDIQNDQIVTSNVSKLHVDQPLSDSSLIEGFIGAIVNIEVAAKGAAFVRSGSTFADLIESIGRFSKCSVAGLF